MPPAWLGSRKEVGKGRELRTCSTRAQCLDSRRAPQAPPWARLGWCGWPPQGPAQHHIPSVVPTPVSGALTTHIAPRSPAVCRMVKRLEARPPLQEVEEVRDAMAQGRGQSAG